MADSGDHKYSMTLSLNVLKHLGFGLYSNVPAVLSEAVANAWDADAEHVWIDIDDHTDSIIVKDDGHGMTVEDANKKYLYIGYERRRSSVGGRTPRFNRDVMGRKGIGKLSLFSIARNVEVHSVCGDERHGFIMDASKIEAKIKSESEEQGNQGNEQSVYYNPEPVDIAEIDIDKGTRIKLTNMKRRLYRSEPALRRRLARRFSIIDPEGSFSVVLDGQEVTVEDRDYYNKLQYIWTYGERGDAARMAAGDNIEEWTERKGIVDVEGSEFRIDGWIGTAKRSGMLKESVGKESINKIVIMVRGKLAQEDVLEYFGEGGVYASYVFGEIQADFLDIDGQEDIATSSRQKIVEYDPRYIALKEFIGGELKEIQSKWKGLRNAQGEGAARSIPAIDLWFLSLGSDQRRKARSMFGKINQLNLADDQRKVLLQNGVIAFETLRHKEQLDRLENLTANDMTVIAKIFYDLDDFEATLYHRIVDERLKIVQALKKAVDDNALEKVLQEHIFSHLWLLDPSWERATATTPYMESTVGKMFEDVKKHLTQEERNSRVDIKYTTAQGKHVIVELKRADAVLTTNAMWAQLDRYRRAFTKVVAQHEDVPGPLEIVCVIGSDLMEWQDPNERVVTADTLKAIGARVVTYQQLINNSEASYREFLVRHQEAGRLSRLIQEIDEWEWQEN